MPAVSADPISLPRLARPAQAGTRWRGVQKVVTAPKQIEGEGFQVRRPFPGLDLALADPFLLLDHMGAVEYAPGEAKGAPWHPHRGFETVTYMIDGAFEHEDSTGGGGLITDGATQWMTAGSGILHSELPPQEMVSRGGCSTVSSSGSTCRPRRSGRPRPIRTSPAPTSRWSHRTTAVPWCG
jgi:hypothetical protein